MVQVFPNSFNFGISGDRTENILLRAFNLSDMSYLTNVIILRGANNICNDSPYDIALCLIDIGVRFRNGSPKVKIFIYGILPRDECFSVNRMLIKEINTNVNVLFIVSISLNKNKAGLITTTSLILHCFVR